MSRLRAATAASLFLAFSLSLSAQLGPSNRMNRFPTTDSQGDVGESAGKDLSREARLTGVVQDRASHPMDKARVELRHLNTGLTLTSTYTRQDGSFELEDLQAGRYEIVVTSGVSEVRQELEVTPGDIPVTVRMPVLTADYSGPSTVSVSEMAVPDKARKEAQKAEQNLNRKPEDARKELTRALEIYPKYGKAHMLLGILNLMQRRVRDAIRELEASVQYDPGDARAFIALASAYNTQERYPDAVRALDSGERLAPTSWQGYMEMARARLGMKDYSNALEQVTKAEQLCPSNYPAIHMVKADILLGLRDYPRASKELEEYLSSSPNGPDAEVARRTLDQVKAFDTARK